MAHAGHAETDHAKDCCPPLEKCESCDVLDLRYRLPFRPVVTTVGDRRITVPVEVTLRFRLERCPGPLAQGDLVYSTTLLPGEKVRLFSSDRHSRFSFDTESKLSYRHETTTEETLFASGMASAMSDLSVVENGRSASSFHESSVSGGGGAGIDLGFFEIGGSVSGSSHDAQSVNTFSSALSRHAESSSRHVEVATRAASSTAVGEVQNRTHTQGESEDHYESSSRVFANPNRCHALTFYFYKINKCQKLRFTLVGIDRRVVDAAAPTEVVPKPALVTGGVSVRTNALLATSKDRLEAERRARTSVAERAEVLFKASSAFANRLVPAAAAEPLGRDVRKAALEAVDKDLVDERLLAAVGGEVSPEAQKRLGWERTIVLPTPGMIVKGCLDECDICEPSLDAEIQLELERKKLENELLKRRIQLLDKAQEYRCCPADSEEEDD